METLADLRNINPEEFDKMVKEAVKLAAEEIGVEATIKALTNS